MQLSTLAQSLEGGEASDFILSKYREGQSFYAIALILQEDLLLYTEVAQEQLIRAIAEFCQTSTSVAERLELFGTGRNAIARAERQQKRLTNVRTELQRLHFLQMSRIERLVADEELDGSLKGMGANEIEIDRRLLMNIHDVNKDLGEESGMGSAASGGKISPELSQKLGRLLHRMADKIIEEEEDVIDVKVLNEPT